MEAAPLGSPGPSSAGPPTGKKPSLWSRAGFCYLQAGELKAAAKCAEQAADVSLSAMVAEAGRDFAGAARLYERAGRPGDAVRCFAQAEKWDDVARVQLAGADEVAGAELTLERRLPPAPAIAALERLLRDSPVDAPIRLRAVPALSSCLVRAGRHGEGRRVLQEHGGWLVRTRASRPPEERARGWLRLAEAAGRGGWEGLRLTGIALASEASPPQEATRDEIRREWAAAGGEPESLPWPAEDGEEGQGRSASRRRRKREQRGSRNP